MSKTQIKFTPSHELVCEKCGKIHEVSFEVSAVLFCDYVKSFIKEHENCK